MKALGWVLRWKTFAGLLFGFLAVSGCTSGDLRFDSEESGLECNLDDGSKAIERFLAAKGEDGLVTLLDTRTASLIDGVALDIVSCSDLNEDEVDEMVLSADAVGSGSSRPVSWFILERMSGSWKVVFRRTVPLPRITEIGGGLTESIPGFALGSSFKPTFRIPGIVSFERGVYRYFLPGLNPREKMIRLDRTSGQLSELGGLELGGAEPEDAEAAFGRPSLSLESGSDLCLTIWHNLGIWIDFVNLGGLDPCEVGRVSRVSLEGSAARTSGWRGPWGIEIGMTLKEVSTRAPSVYETDSPYEPSGIQEDWDSWVLADVRNPFGGGDPLPTVTGFFDDGRLDRLEFWVGAAGE